MRKSQQLTLILIIMTLSSTMLYASPVANLDIAITQPNSVSAAGKTFSLKPQGDEWSNWYETYDGYTVIKDELTHV